MAAEFFASHGIEIDSVMSRIQFGTAQQSKSNAAVDYMHITPISKITGARLPEKPAATLWDVSISHGSISAVEPHEEPQLNVRNLSGLLDAQGRLLVPSLCHAHVHLDKCFLLQDPKYDDLEIVKGDFEEAMTLTGQAKARFEEEDLLRRGRRMIEESIEAGVTCMRAFVEVDEVVGLKCLEAGLKLKEEFREFCEVQVCAFAQLALFTGEDGGVRRRELIEEAWRRDGVDVVGSTPYVESDQVKMRSNVEWAIRKALDTGKHLDFHLDYNLDPTTEPLIWYVVEELKKQQWLQKAASSQKICLGHCTRLTLLKLEEWQKLKSEIGELPISLVGLLTSDLFMMGRPDHDSSSTQQRVRGTLQVPEIIQRYDINCAIAVNNVGNAFTPQGSCDPLSIASLGVALYQAGTKKDTEVLFVSAEIVNQGVPD